MSILPHRMGQLFDVKFWLGRVNQPQDFLNREFVKFYHIFPFSFPFPVFLILTRFHIGLHKIDQTKHVCMRAQSPTHTGLLVTGQILGSTSLPNLFLLTSFLPTPNKQI